jgi:bifunctional non-homologous end joining protein LigD
MRVGRHTIEVSHQDKILFPDDGITKGEVIEYYRKIADVMLPHMQGRPVVMQRFPDGIAQDGFYHKEEPEYFPGWIETMTVEKEGGEVTHVVCNDAATLVYLANQACLTPHTWLSRTDAPRRPDQLILDLDPPEDDFGAARFAARAVRDLLDELGLRSFVKTSGSRGLHVLVPLDRSGDFDAVRSFAHGVASLLAARHPERLTTEPRKSDRRGRLYLDVGRNAYAQTAAPPYALRARPGAPVAAPLEWEELGRGDLSSRSYTLKNIFARLGQKADPWKEIARHAQSLERARRRLVNRVGDG